jgi:6-phosphogluconolactonase
VSSSVVVAADADVLAHAVAARLITAIVDAQTAHGGASVVLAGGTVAIASLSAVAASPARGAVDWGQVDVWWGDERFVAADSPDRNELQAREALLDRVPLSQSRVHPMGALGGPDGEDLDAAAARYAALLDQAPPFDVVLLGMGSEGHTASIFPDSPAARDERTAFAVRDCPKPPPLRISLGFAALSRGREVWLVASGAEKAEAVARALSGVDRVQCPAAGPQGTMATRWLLDRAAAGR